MRGKKVLQLIVFSLPLVLIVFLLFNVYTVQNHARIAEQNKNYAEDSMRQKTKQVAGELESGGRIINAYAYFFNDSLTGDTIRPQTLAEIERNSIFDTVRFTDAEGVTHLSDGRTVNSSDRDYYARGMAGESGISVIFDERLTDEATRLVFYAPVRMDGEIVGIIRGSYVAEQYLKEILRTTYFGEPSTIWLCRADGRVIASSDDVEYGEGHLLDILQSSDLIGARTVEAAKAVFENGGEGAFICEENSKTDNLCVSYVPGYDYVMVQLFPPSVTQKMIKGANAAGVRLETALLILFAIYFIFAIVRAAKERKKLEAENSRINYVLQGLNTLFSSRYLTVDLETGVYTYTGGVNLQDSQLVREGDYANVLENHSQEIIGEEAQEDFRQTLKVDSVIENLSDQDTFTFECHVMRDGKEEWEQLITVCLERHEGRASKILYVRQNITEMKQREQRRQKELAVMNRKERQYRIAITSNAFSTFELNLTQDRIEQDVVSTRNGETVSLLEKAGLQAPCRASECFERWKQYVLSESMEDYANIVDVAYLKRSFEQGEAEVDVDYWSRVEGKEGRMCVRQSFFMTKDDMTDDIIAMVVSKDITDQVIKQKEQTEALQDALMHARQANEAKTTFLSNMSHDIRTPMNGIIGMTEIAIANIDNPRKVRSCLQKISASGKHLLGLINNVLDMSKMESGKLILNVEQILLPELIHGVVNIILPSTQDKKQRFDLHVHDIIAESVWGDSVRLNQTLHNLLENAVRFTPEGGNIKLNVYQTPSEKGNAYVTVHLIVSDNGVGMSEEFLKRIFEAFAREDNARVQQIQGAGLGLSITKQIVDAMGGTIQVESEQGKGSSFHVSLDMEAALLPEEEMDIPSWRTLVIDDDEVFCDCTLATLESIGIHAQCALNGQSALEMLEEQRQKGNDYEVILTDWKLPGMDGVEVAREIRNRYGEKPYILMSSAADNSDIEEQARQAGVDAFIVKPLFKSTLYYNLNRLKAEAESPEESPISFDGEHILVAEDNDLNWEIVSTLLSSIGLVPEHAENGRVCVDMLTQSPEGLYQAILMDIRMPVMNGLEAASAIRALDRDDAKRIPIIAISADAFSDDIQRCIDCGMDDHTSKPIDVNRVAELLRKYMQ